MSRTSSLTPETADKILGLIRAGNYVHIACAAVGIHKDTYYGWRERGKKGEEPYASFLHDLELAEAECEVLIVAEQRKAITSSDIQKSTAAMTFLDRRFRDRWGRKDRVEVTGQGGGPLAVSLQEIEEAKSAIAANVANAGRERGEE